MSLIRHVFFPTNVHNKTKNVLVDGEAVA